MKKKRHGGITALIIVILILAVTVSAYCIYAQRQYASRFMKGTRINGIDAAEMTVEEVEKKIKNRVENYNLTISFRDGRTETIDGSSIDFCYASDSGVQSLMDHQNIYEWGLGMLGQSMSFSVGESYTYDEEKLREMMLSLPEFNSDNVIEPQDAHLAIGSDHMIKIVPGVDGNALRENIVFEAIKNAIDAGENSVDISSLGNAYKMAEIRSDDHDLNTQKDDLNTYLSVAVTYQMYDGTEVILDNKTTSGWLSIMDGSNEYYYMNTDVLMDKCQEFITSMAAKYDNVTDSVTFHSTNRGDILIPTKQYGYQIDQTQEPVELYNIILGRKSETREPLYLVCRSGSANFGGTYIEVDIQYQHVYYYIDGSIYIDTPCVTGLSTSADRRTPTGIYSIYEKDTDRILRGEYNEATGEYGYESHVNYWMRFNEGVGLHDATWRSSFGGDIYTYSGSHGCVNLPYSAAEEIYNTCSNGTVVVVI